MAALPDLITVQQFRRMPDDGRAYELHHGEVVTVTRPKAKHYHLQRRFVRLLENRLAGFGQVGMEFPYRPVAEFDLRVADVALVSQPRYDQIDPEDNLRGAPELVIEIKSPSNTDRQLRELASLGLANGGTEFWIVDTDDASVTVIHRDGSSSRLRPPQSIPLTAFGGNALPLAEIFG
ncbi:MAG: Uma2 family endonuclease [Bryobacteraceae bacterium]